MFPAFGCWLEFFLYSNDWWDSINRCSRIRWNTFRGRILNAFQRSLDTFWPGSHDLHNFVTTQDVVWSRANGSEVSNDKPMDFEETSEWNWVANIWWSGNEKWNKTTNQTFRNTRSLRVTKLTGQLLKGAQSKASDSSSKRNVHRLRYYGTTKQQVTYEMRSIYW